MCPKFTYRCLYPITVYYSLFLLCTFVMNHVVHSGVSNIQAAFHNSVDDVETYFKLNERVGSVNHNTHERLLRHCLTMSAVINRYPFVTWNLTISLSTVDVIYVNSIAFMCKNCLICTTHNIFLKIYIYDCNANIENISYFERFTMLEWSVHYWKWNDTMTLRINHLIDTFIGIKWYCRMTRHKLYASGLWV